MQGVICRLLQGRIKRGDGHEALNLPFPFYSKGRERKGDGLAGWKTGKKERRQRTPADAAFIFRGTSAQKPNRLNEAANKRIPRQRERFRRGWWTAGKEPYADPRLSPRGLPNPAGRFRHGATCGNRRHYNALNGGGAATPKRIVLLNHAR